MLKIWGRKNSINVQKVVWCCDELGLAFERIDAGGQFGINNTPEYRALNPNGLVPTIDDEGYILWESNAIVRYLSRKHGEGKLWPKDPRTCANADRWMEWYSTTLWPVLRPVFWELVRVAPDQRNMAMVEDNRKKVAAALAIADAHLGQNQYLAGDSFSMGDIPLAAAAFRWFNLPVARAPSHNLEAWHRRICERPAFKQHCMAPLT